MQTPRFVLALTVLNLCLLAFSLASHIAPAAANAPPQVLRGTGLEIVDTQGRVRASITLHPAHFHQPSGQDIPETVVLRLIDGAGRPEVKIGASHLGSGMSLIGETDATQVILQADRAQASLKLANKDGRLQLLKP